MAALDVAAQPCFLAPLLRHVALSSRRRQPVNDAVMVRFPGKLGPSARLKLLDDLVTCFLAVSAFGVVLGSFLVSIVRLHRPSIVVLKWLLPQQSKRGTSVTVAEE